MNEDARNSLRQLPSHLNPWVKFLVGLTFIGAAIFAVYKYIVEREDFDLTVHIRQVIPITLPEDAPIGDFELRYRGIVLQQAIFAELRIENTGAKLINPVSSAASDVGFEHWTLNIATKDVSKIIPIAQGVTSNTEVLNYKIFQINSGFSIHFGKLNPRDWINLQVIVVNPEDIELPQLSASSNADYLSRPTVTTKEPIDRILEKILWPAIVIVFLVIVLGIILDFTKNRPQTAKERIEFFVMAVFQTFAGSTLLGSLVAIALAWVVHLLRG